MLLFVFGALIALLSPQNALLAQKLYEVAPESTSSYSRSGADIQVDKDVVLVPVSVLDWKNRPINDLEKKDFKLFDDKVERSIESLSAEDEPAVIGLVFDTSSSMEGKLRQSLAAVKKFLATVNPADEVFLIEFGNTPRLAVPTTDNALNVALELGRAETRGKTALFDAIHLGLAELRRSKKTRKALVVISDGADNYSRLTARDIHQAVRESDALIFAIAIYDPFNSDSLSPEEMAGPMLLRELAEETGGREFPAGYPSELDAATVAIDKALRSIYVLGFSPPQRQQPGYHNLQVKVARPSGSLVASWRLGYYASQERWQSP